jgi:cytochrome c551/c552
MGAVTSSKYMCIACINIDVYSLGPLYGPENILLKYKGMSKEM